MTEFGEYRHIVPVQIRFSDIDRLNHVNNACYHNYIELGRVKYFEKVLGSEINWDKRGFVLARTEMDHLEQVYLNDDIYCCTRVFRFGNKSIGVQNAIIKKSDGRVLPCAEVKAVLVAMDYIENSSIPVPERWKKLIAGFEGIKF